MVSSGIDELDRRLHGGLLEGRFYVLSGTPGSGKTSACIHFLSEGLTAGEPCTILTQENPSDLWSQAEFLGCDFMTHARSGLLAVLQYRLDFAQNYARVADPQRVADEFASLIDEQTPRRLVVDTILPLVDAGSGPHGAANALLHLMERFSPTTYFTLPGDVADSYYARAYDTIVTGAAGIFNFTAVGEGVRQLEIRKSRQGAQEAEPIRFVLKPGAGISEPSAASRAKAAPVSEVPESTRILLLHTEGHLPEEFRSSLSQQFEVAHHVSLEAAFGDIAGGDYCALLIVLDPQEADRVFDVVRGLRQAGNGAPIIFVSTMEGLRGTTRARGLRAGADDFISDDLAPQEFLARVDAACRRGHRDNTDPGEADVVLLQPKTADGEALSVDESELARAVRRHLKATTHPYFAIIELETAPEHAAEVWKILCHGLRLADGDLISRRGPTRFVMYLHDINRRRVEDLLSRILRNVPTGAVRQQTIHGYPVDSDAIRSWLNQAGGSDQRASA